MALPKVQYPMFPLTIPSTGELVKFRPFTVAEEKVLLMAAASENPKSTTDAVLDVLDVCFLKSVDVRNLPSFDVEYMFLNVRSKSVSEMIELEYRNQTCPEEEGSACKKSFLIRINIDDIKVQKFDPVSDTFKPVDISKSSKSGTKIMISEDMGVMIKYPTVDVIAQSVESASEFDQLESIVCQCITSVFDTENVYTDFTKDEMKEWFQALTTKQKEPIQEFIKNLPVVRYEYLYKCKTCGYEEKINIEGLYSFL